MAGIKKLATMQAGTTKAFRQGKLPDNQFGTVAGTGFDPDTSRIRHPLVIATATAINSIAYTAACVQSVGTSSLYLAITRSSRHEPKPRTDLLVYGRCL
jgi:hypothetical protein